MEINSDIRTLWELVEHREPGEMVLIEMGEEMLGVCRITKEFERKVREAKE